MDQDPLLAFPESSASGRAGNVGLALLGPVGFPLLSAVLVWAMIRAPGPASRLFPLFGALEILLYLGAGPLWAFVAGIFASFLGIIGFFFSPFPLSKPLFAADVALFWALLGCLYRIDLQRRAILERFEEECDRADLDATRLSSDNARLREEIDDGRERMAS